jgi:signal transduction histidine kinase/ligand-binding sensor domain-containing protein
LNDGLLRLEPDGRFCLYTVQGQTAHFIKAITERDGVLWVSTRFGLLALRPEPTLQDSSGTRHRVVIPQHRCLQSESTRASWPLHDGGACLFDVRDGLPDSRVVALLQSPAGRLWIATMGGLAYLEGGRFTTVGSSVSPAGVYSLVQDNDGHLWIGTLTGVLKLSPDGLVSYGLPDGLGDARIYTFSERPGGGLYAISGNWIVNRFDGRRFHAIRPRVPETAIYTYYSHGVFLDRTGRWWLLTDQGLHGLRARASIEAAAREIPELVYTARNGLPDNNVVRVFEDSRGDIWIATRSRRTVATNLSRWERATGTIRPVVARFDAANQFPIAFAEDRNGAIWIGFETGGLARYHDGRFTLFGSADGAPGNVMDLHLDGAGKLWIASSSDGVSVLEDMAADTPRFVRYTTAQGLSTNNIQCLTEDRWGRVYLGTGRGLDRVDPITGHVKHISMSDGLAGDYVTAAFRDRDGGLWFGTTVGVSRLNPVAETPSAPPSIWIGEVRAGGGLQPLPELGAARLADLTLRSGQSDLQIAFFGVGFGTGGALRYRYRLDGAESNWSGPTDRRVVHYASLAPGRYRFIVEALNADGIASAQAASLAVTVLPPFWQRWWFASLTLLLVTSLAYAFHRARIARLIELERVRARIAADLHDDIGGSLSRIAIQTEVASRDVVEHDGTAARRLVEIGDTARGMVESLGDVVWSVDPVHDDLASVERRVREYAAEVLGARGVRWTFHGTGDRDHVRLDPEARRDLMLLLKEGVTNVARHADARVASLQLHLAGGSLHAELRDDGRGFEAAALEAQATTRGHGLANMRLRARQLGGRLDIESTPGIGTRLFLTVPVSLRRRMNMRLRLARGWQSIRSDTRPGTPH